LENATLLIGKQFIKIEKKSRDSNSSYFWRVYDYEPLNKVYYYEINFLEKEYTGSLTRKIEIIKNLCFLSLFTWGKLPKDKIISSIGSNLHKNIVSSITSNLDSGKNYDLYTKHGKKSLSSFELHNNFRNSKLIKCIRFIPSEEAVATVRKRAKAKKYSQRSERKMGKM